MSECRWCDRHGIFRVDAEGICKKCREEIDLDTGRLITSIGRLKRSYEDASEPSVKLEYVKSIIEQAKRLARYERRGISLNGTSSSAILEEFRAHHDRLLAWDRSEYLGEAIDAAIEQLDPYQELFGIQDALKLIKLTRTLCRDLTSCRRIAVINHKGGVGKTTTAINLSGGLAEQGKKVLAVDFDPQANLTDGLGIDEHELTYTAYEFMKGVVGHEQAIRKVSENLYVLPASLFLSRSEKEYAKTHDNMYLLRNALEKVPGYDYVIIDCPPSLGVLTLNALAASNEVLIPLLPEYYSLKGMRKLYEVIDFVQRKINKSLYVSGVIGVRYDHRKTLHREVFSKIRENLGDKLFYAVIREAIVLAEAASYGKTIFSYQPASHGARDYRKLTDMVLSHNHHGHL